jgi:hypothetical protein
MNKYQARKILESVSENKTKLSFLFSKLEVIENDISYFYLHSHSKKEFNLSKNTPGKSLESFLLDLINEKEVLLKNIEAAKAEIDFIVFLIENLEDPKSKYILFNKFISLKKDYFIYKNLNYCRSHFFSLLHKAEIEFSEIYKNYAV